MNHGPMSCERLGAWLDAGRPGVGADAAAAHAAFCARCAAALAADRAIEAMLAAPAPAAPAGFTGRVMHAVGVASAARAHAPVAGWNDALPWWARAVLHPPALGAAALAALLAWRPDAVEQGGRIGLAATLAAGKQLEAWAVRAIGPTNAGFASSPEAQLGLAVSAALVLALAAIPLYRWTERAALRGV